MTIKHRVWDIQKQNMLYFEDKSDVHNREEIIARSTSNLIYMPNTALADKNGKDIYESDILRRGRGSLALVVWSPEKNKYDLRWLHCEHWIEMNIRTKEIFEEELAYLEVLGNRFENTDLLGERSVIYVDGWTPEKL